MWRPRKVVDLADLTVESGKATTKSAKPAPGLERERQTDDIRSTANLANGRQQPSVQQLQAMQRTVGNQRTNQFLSEGNGPSTFAPAEGTRTVPNPPSQGRSGEVDGPRSGGLGQPFAKAAAFLKRARRDHGYDFFEQGKAPKLRVPDEAPLALAANSHPDENIEGGDVGLGRISTPTDYENDPQSIPTKKTYWAQSEAERKPFHTKVVNGTLSRFDPRTNRYAPLDTTEAKSSNRSGSKEGRNMFVMTPRGSFYSADQFSEMTKNPGIRYHHSTMVGGDEVAGAGEISTSKEGKIEWLTDGSGHYKPEFPLTHQMLSQMDRQGADLSRTTVELVGKRGGQSPVLMSAHEALAWRWQATEARKKFAASRDRSELADPEQKIRALHDRKDKTLFELRGAFDELVSEKDRYVLPPKPVIPPVSTEGRQTASAVADEGDGYVGEKASPEVLSSTEPPDTATSQALPLASEPGAPPIEQLPPPQHEIDERSIGPVLLGMIKQRKENRAAWAQFANQEFARRRG